MSSEPGGAAAAGGGGAYRIIARRRAYVILMPPRLRHRLRASLRPTRSPRTARNPPYHCCRRHRINVIVIIIVSCFELFIVSLNTLLSAIVRVPQYNSVSVIHFFVFLYFSYYIIIIIIYIILFIKKMYTT